MPRGASVIVPTFNRAHLLPECLDALLAQTLPPDEIIVVNDGSTDGTREALEQYRDRVKALHKPNGGKASALNAGLGVATGDLIWIFDDDDISLPHALETHMDALSRNPDAGFTYSGYHLGVQDQDGGIVIAKTYKPFRGPARSLFLQFAMGASGPDVGFMLQQGMLVRRRCYDKLGPFEESFTYGEDVDMDLRLCLSFRGVPIETPTFIIRRHEGPRGPEADRYSYARREAKLRETDRKVYRKLYETTDLARFLDEDEPDTSQRGWEGEALVNRARIMAKWGHHDLVMDDLRRLSDLIGRGMVPLDKGLLDGLVRVDVTCQRAGSLRDAREVRRLAAGLVRINDDGGTLRNYLAKRYFWKGVEEYRLGKRAGAIRGVARALGVACRVGGRPHREPAKAQA